MPSALLCGALFTRGSGRTIFQRHIFFKSSVRFTKKKMERKVPEFPIYPHPIHAWPLPLATSLTRMILKNQI